nr:MAG TPA: Minor structural protein 4 [Caudoviricetes sp.]
MGYKLLYDKQILFDVYSGDYVTDAQLSMSVNAISYFDFTISLTHSLYDIIAEHAGIVELYFDDAKLFSGEITEISVDLNGNKDITCAGALDYLSYTLVRPYSTIDGEADLLAPSSVDGYFNWLIEQHNKHCLDSRKHFSVGVNQGNLLDNNNYIYRASSTLPTTSSEIEDKILNSVGGYLYVRYKDDKNILDLYADTHEANTQIIDFGVNITDFVKTTSTDDQYTAVIATGYTPDPPEDDPQKKMNPINLEGCVDGGTPYSPSIVKMGDVVYDVNAVARYGYKEYHVSNDDIKTYDGLLQYACKVLNKLLSPSLSVSVKAVDLSLYMKDKYEHMQVGQAVRVRSKLHDIDEYLVVNSITLDMNNPENTEYQLGESYDTLTGQQSSYLRSLNSSIVSNLDSVAKLDSETKKNAKDIAETKDVASNAANKADKASEDSSKAIKNANEAKDTANSAATEAGKATEAANSANAKADQATDIANSAKQEASTASNIASEAKKTADKAQADTNTNTKAVAQAQSTADAAKKAAADAQEKAENVESNLDSANAVIEQHSNKLGELDTKVSNAVTNANSALTASTEAKQTATEASTTANTAYKDSQTAIANSTKATQTATEAKTTAESAVSTANDSLKQSSSAVQTANRIENTLTTEYQTKADSDALYATKSSLTETSESIKMEVSATYATKSTVEALQNVADNAIESWRGSGVPTSENKPASDWTTIEEKKRHSGDLYYDKDTGKAYRWGSDDGVIYSWVLNQDTDITKALQDASNAQKSADAAQSTANGAVTAAGNAQKSADGAQSTADSAKTAASNAQKAADTAQLDVDQLKIDIPGTYATKASLETTAKSITAQVESVSTTANSAVTAASKAQQTADAISINLTKNYQTKENADNTYATKASLSATSEGLTASITKAQQTADGAVNAASNAQQTADAISINLTKNYQTTKDADDKYATQSSLSATADSITASVSKTYSTKTELSSAIDGISVGGRNLLTNTGDGFKPTDAWAQGDSTWVPEGYYEYWNYIIPKTDPYYETKLGDVITISFDAEVYDPAGSETGWLALYDFTSNPSVSIGFDNVVFPPDSVPESTLVKIRGFATRTLISHGTEDVRAIAFYCGYGSGRYFKISRLKIERGNKPTDWSPAPEDLVAESKTYTDAQIKVSADSINSTVSSIKTTADNALSNANSALDQINEIPGTYATKTEVNQTATDLTTTITSVQTTANEAKGTADSAKTSTNILETLIRQSGDGVEVAKKVNDEYTSTKTLMGPDGFYIKDLTDTALTQVKSDSIILGKETESHMHINPENVRLLNGDEKELAKFYENGVSLSSNDFIIRSPIKSDPVTDIRTIGGFNIHSVLDDRFQSIVPIDNNNTCSIVGSSNVFNKTSIGENITTITEASSMTVIKARANAKGTDTTADSNASISIGAFSSVYNSSSTVDNASDITIKANIIQLRAKDRVDIKGHKLDDFVKELGTSTTTDSQWSTRTWEWRWIKTYSGKCFAWGECGFNIGCTTAWGSGYYDHVCPVYPFKLSKWNVQASVSFIGGGIGHTGIYDDSATQCPIYIWSAVYQNTGSMFVKVFVEGVLA